jgi:hypothetical protein
MCKKNEIKTCNSDSPPRTRNKKNISSTKLQIFRNRQNKRRDYEKK